MHVLPFSEVVPDTDELDIGRCRDITSVLMFDVEAIEVMGFYSTFFSEDAAFACRCFEVGGGRWCLAEEGRNETPMLRCFSRRDGEQSKEDKRQKGKKKAKAVRVYFLICQLNLLIFCAAAKDWKA